MSQQLVVHISTLIEYSHILLRRSKISLDGVLRHYYYYIHAIVDTY